MTKINTKGKLIFIITALISLGLTVLFSFIKWQVAIIFPVLYIVFVAFIFIMLNKYERAIEKSNRELRKHADMYGHKVLDITQKQFDELNKDGATILDDGTPISKHEVRYL